MMSIIADPNMRSSKKECGQPVTATNGRFNIMEALFCCDDCIICAKQKSACPESNQMESIFHLLAETHCSK